MFTVKKAQLNLTKKSANPLLLDIAQAALQIQFITGEPKLFLHIDQNFIEVHLRKECLVNEIELRDTAIDVGMLINNIRTLIMTLGYEPFLDLELKENGSIRVAKICIGQPLKVSIPSKVFEPYFEIKQHSKESLFTSLQNLLIEKQLYLQRIDDGSTKSSQFAVIGAVYHLGGWLEVGMHLDRSLTQINKMSKSKLKLKSSKASTHIVSTQDRNRGRRLIACIKETRRDEKANSYLLSDYLV